MSDYDWFDIEAIALTFLRGARLEEVVHVLRLDPATERMRTFDDAEEDPDVSSDAFPVQMEELEGWLVVVEPNGFLMTDHHVLSRLSRGGTAICWFRNINAVSDFLVARDGEIVRAFDPVLFDDEEGAPLPEEEGLDFADEDADPDALALTLMERLTGVRIEESWLLERPRRTWLAPHPPPTSEGPPAGRPGAPGVMRRLFSRLR
ncbi:DUF6461 domain-containing protein [Blastococcus sp. LR1]|uniref:DUF6461 domain-containing protein n=1 Tax=Blastococcus sp. LR1 TaxID=2877000 RepID=UPI001CCE9045|nr:DUF6461 domain-containing protein [Blastococcus sp. LR1]MCA0144204.1 DUF6461 domain-containing protein [Blastococcus sp. LR1]